MWPFRPERLTDVIPAEDLRTLLEIGVEIGSTLSLVEPGEPGSYRSIEPRKRGAGGHSDPFCTFFRHGMVGGAWAFDGADEACSQCEQRFARRLLDSASTAPLPTGKTGVARLRCHMGLTDYLVPVHVGGKLVAGLIGGRRVEEEDDRLRIRKAVGKLGKLTRAEQETAGSTDRILIQPADEKVRDRLLHEIGQIPSRSDEFEEHLASLGAMISGFATRQFDSFRRIKEDEVIERVDGRVGEPPKSFTDLRRDAGVLLDLLRVDLGLDYLGFFALLPKELEKRGTLLSLVAESGLGVNTSRRVLELDWTRLPPAPGGPRGDVTRGLEAVSSTINAICATTETPSGLKDRLTKCAFLAPVESAGMRFPSALVFGSTSGSFTPDDGDYRFLVRLARAVSRRYYSLAAEAERQWLLDRLQSEEEARKKSEESRKAAQEVLRKAEEAKILAARHRGFTHFDLRKLVDQCLEKAGAFAGEQGVEIDSRALLERAMYDGDRSRLGSCFTQILRDGIQRTQRESEEKKPAPLRVYLTRSSQNFVLGVEAIGDFLTPQERRMLFQAPQVPPAPRASASAHRAAGAETSTAASEGPAAGTSGRPAESLPPSSLENGVAQDGGGSERGQGVQDVQEAGEPEHRAAREAVTSEDTTDREAGAAGGSEGAARDESGEGMRAGGAPRNPPPGSAGAFRSIVATVRRHDGRFRVDSERLRRFEKDPHRWVGRTAFVIELPIPAKGEEPSEKPAAASGPPPVRPGRAREDRAIEHKGPSAPPAGEGAEPARS